MSDLPSKSSGSAVDDQAYDRAQEVIAVKPKRKWQSYIWDTFDKSPEERKFLFKIDTALLTLALTHKKGYFIKYLDQSNINNAFVSGMYVSLLHVSWISILISNIGKKISVYTAISSTTCRRVGLSATLLVRSHRT
jgi:hypothetical protein